MNVIRNANGFCIPCKNGEKGLLIGIIGNKPKTSYNGYANSSKESSKKVIENVFKRDQKAFNSGKFFIFVKAYHINSRNLSSIIFIGDILVRDRYGFMYFCDRTGDTYRWRGENVSTIEIENVISKKLNSAEVVVYGVEIRGEEGRAGMAAILLESIDMQTFYEQLKQELPSYAMPLFIRLVKNLDYTGTFKAKKFKLVEEAYNATAFDDKLFYFNSTEKCYKELNADVYQDILNGKIRF